MTTRLEVRCCCEPDRLLGWLDLPERCCHAGAVLVLPLMMEPASVLPRRAAERHTSRAAPRLHLEVAKWARFTPDGSAVERETRLAVKDNGASIEQLRLVWGFIEA